MSGGILLSRRKKSPAVFTKPGTRLYPFVETTMTGKTWKLIALVVTTVGAIATAGPLGPSQTDAPLDDRSRPVASDQICTDTQVAQTFGGDGAVGCQAYLDACLGELTAHQRAAWRRSVDACLSSDGSFYRCYAEVPWC
jgi:hypothetical protein